MLQAILTKLFRHVDITKAVDGEEVLYLRRWYILRTRFGQILLHNILRSDDDPDPHDHPWSFLTIVLKGEYLDEAYEFVPYEPFGEINNAKDMGFYPDCSIWLGRREFIGNEPVRAFRPKHRIAEHIHRVILTKPVWSLVFTGKTRRPWGFVKPGEWVFWRKYLNNWNGRPI